jgi:hypothetical protein
MFYIVMVGTALRAMQSIVASAPLPTLARQAPSAVAFVSARIHIPATTCPMPGCTHAGDLLPQGGFLP